MEIQFAITRHFDEDLRRLPPDERSRVNASIDQYATTFDIEHGDAPPHIYQPHKISLPEGLDSSLYVLRATPESRVILSIEYDPLFDQKRITLIRLVDRDEIDQAFDSVAEFLYQDIRAGNRENGRNQSAVG